MRFEKPSGHTIVSPPKSISGTSVRILGCGTSSGVPVLGCTCVTCKSTNTRNYRMRTSASIQVCRSVFLIDTSPDLRTQAFKAKLQWVDAVLFTHPHADHVHGIDDLRTFNFIMARPIPCYGNEWTIKTIKSRFDYIFKPNESGSYLPALKLNIIKDKTKIAGSFVQPLELIHGNFPVLGYRINDVAYITDCSYIPDRTFSLLEDLDILVLDCLRFTKHSTHLNVESALETAKKIGARRTYFTHMGHEIEYIKFAKELPPRMFPSFDGLVIRSKRRFK